MATHRRFASESATGAQRRPRPLSILSPPLSQNARFSMALPVQFEEIILQLEEKKEKVYYEGYIQKLDVTGGNTRLQKEGGWQEVYASLSGTVLSTWPAADLDLADTIGALSKVPPSYINLMDARIDQHDGSNHLVITTAGNKQVRLRSSHGSDVDSDLARWLLAIRISAFERSRMQEAYSANLFLKFQTKETTHLMGAEEVWTGFVDARICGGDVVQTQWSKFWCIITQTKQKTSLAKRLPSFSTPKLETEIQFFSDKKDKVPRIVMHDIFAAYACYPEHMSLIETAGVVKLEGNVHLKSTGPKPNSAGFALIIPAAQEKSKRLSLSTSSSSKPVTLVENILRFLYAIWSTFHLYNLPDKLLLNDNHVDALGLNNALLDLKVETIEQKGSRKCTTDRAWKSFLRQQAHASMTQTSNGATNQTSLSNGNSAYRRTGSDRRVVSEGAIRMPAAKPLVTSIEEDEENERLEALKAQESANQSYARLVPQVALVGSGRQQVQEARNPANVAQLASLDRPTSPFNGLDNLEQDQHETPALVINKRGSKDSQTSSNSSVPDSTLQALGPNSASVRNLAAKPPLRDLESPKLPRVTPDNDPDYASSQPAIRRIISDHFTPQQHRPSIPGRVFSHDSHQSEVSESSVYSAGLDPAALDLVSQYPVQATDYSQEVQQLDREGSIYSVTRDDESDYASTIGEQALRPTTESSIAQAPVTEPATSDASKRLDALSALDIARPARTSPSNPYARPRPRVSQ